MQDLPQGAIDSLLAQTREAITSGQTQEAVTCIASLRGHAAQVGPVAGVDLLERTACFGNPEVAEALYDALGEIVYEGWALALALRVANEPVARMLLDRGVDLLGPVRQPTTYRALLPHEGTFTRFDLTRRSPTLFLNPMDPTVSSEVFEPFRGRANESLARPAYDAPTNLETTCDLVARLAQEGCFDAVVFDDLLRAALVHAWHALRHQDQRDETAAEICLAFGSRMLDMYFMRGQGDDTVRLILGSLIVPKVHPRMVSFVCDKAPDVFLERLSELSWLQADVDLVAQMVPHLSPSTEEHNGKLLLVLARAGRMAELMQLEGWADTFTERNVDAALEAASSAGHAEAAAWLLAHKPRRAHETAGDVLPDLLL